VQELFPLAVGVFAGLGVARISLRMRVRLLAAVAVAGGLVASAVSGEFAQSPLFALWDATQATLAALASTAIVRRVRRPHARQRR
jgi:hypothetical protein